MSRTWGWVFAQIYDPFLWLGERAGMREQRAALVGRASGRVLEIGAGTGLNLAHYPAVEELILSEPDEPMARRLEARVHAGDTTASVVRAKADALPLPDDSLDTVVSTLVLCTVDEPTLAVREIARVLRPGGRLLFIEHVRSEHRVLGQAQDLLMRPWRAFAGNCHCNRRTLELLERQGFEVSDLARASWRRMPPLIRPLVQGSAIVHGG